MNYMHEIDNEQHFMTFTLAMLCTVERQVTKII